MARQMQTAVSSSRKQGTSNAQEWTRNKRDVLGCVSSGESENGFVIPDHMDSSTPKKRKIRKRIILS